MYIVVAGIGVVLLVVTLLFDDVLDGMTPDLDYLSGPVIGSAMAGFGLFGWFADGGLGLPIILAVAIGLAGAALLGAFTWKLTTALINQPTDPTPTTEGLIGRSARVVTPVLADGVGEVIIALGGAPTKYTATADVDLATGTTVVVVAVESSTKVRVQSEQQFWE